MVHSASITSWPTAFERVYLSRHVIFLVMSVCASYVCALVPARFWWSASPYFFALTIVLLVCVLVPDIGVQVNGARRWIRVWHLSMQPSEIAKLSVPLLMGRLIIQYRATGRNRLLVTILVLLPLFLAIPLVFAEPDLGTSMYLSFVGLLLLWIAGWPLWSFLVGLVIAVPGLFVFFSMKAYQWERIRGFLSGWENANQASYQIRQSLISLSEGGIHGVGLGKGWQKLSYLPEANTDFVFSVIGEELGLLGTLCLIGIWTGFFFAGYKILSHQDRWSYQYIVGLTLLCELVLQAALNTAVVTALVPPKGISHPFLSYGGSNLFISLVCVGIVLSLGSLSSNNQKFHPLDRATV